jgi:hypothetical protein
VDLLEGGSYSTLKIIDEHGKNLLTVDYFKNSHDMFIVIDGEFLRWIYQSIVTSKMALVDVCKPFALRQHLYSKI